MTEPKYLGGLGMILGSMLAMGGTINSDRIDEEPTWDQMSEQEREKMRDQIRTKRKELMKKQGVKEWFFYYLDGKLVDKVPQEREGDVKYTIVKWARNRKNAIRKAQNQLNEYLKNAV